MGKPQKKSARKKNRTNSRFQIPLIVRLGILAALVMVIIWGFGVIQKQNTNHQFVNNARELLGVNSATRREDIETRAYQKAYDLSWLVGAPLGSFINTHGRQIEIRLDPDPKYLGETLYISEEDSDAVSYPRPDPLATDEIISGENHAYIYGTQGTVSRLMAQQEVIKRFMDQYFALSKAPVNLLHLTFSPNPAIDFTRPPNLKVAEAPSQKDHDPISYGFSVVWWQHPEAPQITGEEVYLRFYRIEEKAQSLGLSKSMTITGILANEISNLFASQHAFPDESTHHNEAFSTIAGFGAALDEQTAELFLGGTAYKQFVLLMAKEMDNLAK